MGLQNPITIWERRQGRQIIHRIDCAKVGTEIYHRKTKGGNSWILNLFCFEAIYSSLPPSIQRNDMKSSVLGAVLALCAVASTNGSGLRVPLRSSVNPFAVDVINPHTIMMCSSGENSKKVVSFRTSEKPTESFKVQAVVFDKLTGEPASGASMVVDPAGPFEVTGGRMPVTIEAHPAAVIGGTSDYMVKLQIVDPDPISMLHNETKRAEYGLSYTRMQQMLDHHFFIRIKVVNCNPAANVGVRQIAGLSVKALMIADGTEAYLKLHDLKYAFKEHLERFTNYSIPKENVADFEVLHGDRRGRAELHFKVFFQSNENAHQAALAIADNQGRYLKILNKCLHTTLLGLGVQPNENTIKQLVVSEDLLAFDRPIPKEVCCKAATPRCRACAAGMSVKEYCESKPTEVGCSEPGSAFANQTHSKFPVVVRVQLKVPVSNMKMLNNLKLQASIPTVARSITQAYPGTNVHDFKVVGIEIEQPEIVLQISAPTAVVAARMSESINGAKKMLSRSMQHMISDAAGRANLRDMDVRIVKISAGAVDFPRKKAVQVPSPCHGHSCPQEATAEPAATGAAPTHWWLAKTGGVEVLNHKCCTEMTAACQACVDGATVEKYCEKLKVKLPGCPNGPNEKPMCCQAQNAECLSCKKGVSVQEFCAKNPETENCDDIMDKVKSDTPVDIATRQFRTLLKRFDENKDMKITLKEVTSTLKSMPVPAAFASTFIKAAGKDGAVSLEEFKKFVNDSNNEKYINSMHNAYKLMAVADSATPTVSKPEPKNPMNSWEK